MGQRVVNPRGLGLLLIDSHPTGCVRTVTDMCDEVGARADHRQSERPVAVVVGSSAGYGLACTVAGLMRYGINGIGVCFERPPTDRRTATAGWYRTAALAEVARRCGSGFRFLNADAFEDTTKDVVKDLLAERFGGVDYLIYSVAAPRRTDPRNGQTYKSVLKPIGASHRTKTMHLSDDGVAKIDEVSIEPATEDEIAETVKVMGGEDWARWVTAFESRGLLRPGFTTIALSYIGSPLNASIYRNGSIGAAKLDLEAIAAQMNGRLGAQGMRALVSVNGAAVTQSSSAIPGVGLYISILHRSMGGALPSPARQARDLWDQLTGTATLDLDEEGRIRLDRWEFDAKVQEAIGEAWAAITTENVTELADPGWFYDSIQRLYGFRVNGVDYSEPAEVDVQWPPGFTKP